MGKMVYVRNKKVKPGNNGWWSDKKRVEAVSTFLATGNMRITASLINVPIETLYRWKLTEWWKETVEQIQDEDKQELDVKLKKVLDKSLEAVLDRLDNGDFVYNAKTNQIKRIPVKLRDIHRVTSDTIDKRRLIQREVGKEKTDEVGVNDRLLRLAERFAEIATGKKVEEKVVNEFIEGEFDHALSKEREEGLQERAVLGAQEETESS